MSGQANVPLIKSILTERNTRWMDRALCREFDPELFFPDPPANPSKQERARYADDVAIAQGVCALCPVSDACLVDADDRDETWGIWGGVDFYRSKREASVA